MRQSQSPVNEDRLPVEGRRWWQSVWFAMTSIHLGTVAILFSGCWLLIGAITMRLSPQPFRPLLFTSLVDWFPGVWPKPWLWWWMPLLFLSVGVMGISTAFCIVEEFRQMYRLQSREIRWRKLAIAAFHFCVILFLLGHLFMEFSGTNRLVTLSRGESMTLYDEEAELTLIEIMDVPCSIQAGAPRLRYLTVELRRNGERCLRRPGMLSPCFFQELSLYVPLYGPPLAEGEARIQVRHNPGLSFLITGTIVLFFAVILYGMSILIRTDSFSGTTEEGTL